jgi:hypothetical protein
MIEVTRRAGGTKSEACRHLRAENVELLGAEIWTRIHDFSGETGEMVTCAIASARSAE